MTIKKNCDNDELGKGRALAARWLGHWSSTLVQLADSEDKGLAPQGESIGQIVRELALRWLPSVVLGIVGLVNVVRGVLHLSSEYGFSYSVGVAGGAPASDTLVALLSVLGGQQLALGALELWVVFRRQQWVSALLVVQTVLTAGLVCSSFFIRPFPQPAPGDLFNLLLLALLGVGTVFMARNAEEVRFRYVLKKSRVYGDLGEGEASSGNDTASDKSST